MYLPFNVIDSATEGPHLTAPQYYEYFSDRIEVHLLPLPTGISSGLPSFNVELSRTMSYYQMEETIASHVGCMAEFLRFTLPKYVHTYVIIVLM